MAVGKRIYLKRELPDPEIVEQAKGTVVGVGVCVEKKFQPGRAKLEGMGLKVVSLATVVGIDHGKLIVED